MKVTELEPTHARGCTYPSRKEAQLACAVNMRSVGPFPKSPSTVDFRELGQLSGGGAGRALRAAHMARVAAVFGTSGGPRRQGHRRLSAPLSRPRRPGAAGQRPTASVRNEHSRWLAGSIVGALTLAHNRQVLEETQRQNRETAEQNREINRLHIG